MLGDTDRRQSSRAWLGLRPAAAPPIRTWEINGDHIARPPKGTTHVVLDTPAGLHGWRFADVMKLAHRVVVPLQPSMFDILATQDFLTKLADEKRVRHGEVAVGVIGMRVDMRTRAAEQLQRFVEGSGPAGARLPARYAELRATSRARADAVGRGAVARGARLGAVAADPALARRQGRDAACLQPSLPQLLSP